MGAAIEISCTILDQLSSEAACTWDHYAGGSIKTVRGTQRKILERIQ